MNVELALYIIHYYYTFNLLQYATPFKVGHSNLLPFFRYSLVSRISLHSPDNY